MSKSVDSAQTVPGFIEQMAAVLKENDRGTHTSPAILYPHQWLWDSAFIAIGMRHLDAERAAEEVANLIRGQWSNGMIPNMIFNSGRSYRFDRESWSSWLSPFAPADVATSGITQPPMIAEAVVRVGEKLPRNLRLEFYRYMFEPLVQYHTWMYIERDPHNEGLALQIHPYEVGLDNTPPWVHQLYEHSRPWWIALIENLHLQKIVNWLRRDTRKVNPGQRISSLEALLLWDVVRRLRRKRYDIEKILHRSLFCTQDVTFNSIMVRNNQRLEEIAKEIRRKLPDDLVEKFRHSEEALEKLYDEPTGQYYSRDFITHKLIIEPSIGTFMPLYAGTISKERAARLVKILKDHRKYWLHNPVPSVPLDSPFFDADRYWQGPSWVNTNWLIIDGLERYGYTEEAAELRKRTLDMVKQGGPFEYFNPIDGRGLGAANFSWTAALAIDLQTREQTDNRIKQAL